MRRHPFALTLAVFIISLKVYPRENKEAIRRGLSRSPKVVKASWWGFNEEDSTTALQSAINSGADKVIIDNVGKPWIVTPIELASNQELSFEKGVAVLAKKGAFRGKGDCLFTARLKENIKLIGYGATLRMRKADYQGPPYEPAEWRHCLSIRSCKNVKVYGLALAESGGDGMYLGVSKRGVTNSNIHIKDVICDSNHRQGISVITAENLLIENTILKNTSGTPPQAGIDFEPNNFDEKITNCVMRNCVSENNGGYAYVIYLKALGRKSSPISIRFEKCISSGRNYRSLGISTSNDAAAGRMEFIDCVFSERGRAGIRIADVPAERFKIIFSNCTITDMSSEPVFPAPIMLYAGRGCTRDIGGVEFIDCTIRQKARRPLMALRDYAAGEVRVVNVSGKVTLTENGKTRTVHLTNELLDRLMPTRKLPRIPRIEIKALHLVPAFPNMPCPTSRPPYIKLRS